MCRTMKPTAEKMVSSKYVDKMYGPVVYGCFLLRPVGRLGPWLTAPSVLLILQMFDP